MGLEIESRPSDSPYIERMVREGVVASDPLIDAVLHGASPDASERTIQRRFVTATGLTRGAVRQINRAGRAATLIQEGVPGLPREPGARLLRPASPGTVVDRYVGLTASSCAPRIRRSRCRSCTRPDRPGGTGVTIATHRSVR